MQVENKTILTSFAVIESKTMVTVKEIRNSNKMLLALLDYLTYCHAFRTF